MDRLVVVLALLLTTGLASGQTYEDLQVVKSRYERFHAFVIGIDRTSAEEAANQGLDSLPAIRADRTDDTSYRARATVLRLLVTRPQVAKTLALEIGKTDEEKIKKLPGEPPPDSEERTSLFAEVDELVADLLGAGSGDAPPPMALPHASVRPYDPGPLPRPRAPLLPLPLLAVAAVVAAVVVVVAARSRGPAAPEEKPVSDTVIVRPAPVAEEGDATRAGGEGPAAKLAPHLQHLAAWGRRGQAAAGSGSGVNSRKARTAFAAIEPPRPEEPPEPVRPQPEEPVEPAVPPIRQAERPVAAPLDANSQTLSMELDATRAMELREALAAKAKPAPGSGAAPQPVVPPAVPPPVVSPAVPPPAAPQPAAPQPAMPAGSGSVKRPARVAQAAGPWGAVDGALRAFLRSRAPARVAPPVRPEVDSDLLPPRYEILSILGRGGMGIVYRARDKVGNREVAVKTLALEVMETATAKERFYREYEVLFNLEHPNIVRVFDIGVGKLPFYAMESIEGEDLGSILLETTLPQTVVLDVGIQLAGALEYAHKQGILHRDVKPSNLMVTREGLVKIVDFGLVKDTQGERLTQEGTVLGSLRFMAPEQLMALDVEPAADVYAAGSTLYYLVGGETPFEGKPPAAKVTQEAPPIGRLVERMNPGLAAVIMQSIRKSPYERYRTARELEEALRGVKL